MHATARSADSSAQIQVAHGYCCRVAEFVRAALPARFDDDWLLDPRPCMLLSLEIQLKVTSVRLVPIAEHPDQSGKVYSSIDVYTGA